MPQGDRRKPTAALCFSQVRSDLACASADHAQTLRLVERADFLLYLAECQPVLEFAELGLRVGFFGFARTNNVK